MLKKGIILINRSNNYVVGVSPRYSNIIEAKQLKKYHRKRKILIDIFKSLQIREH